MSLAVTKTASGVGALGFLSLFLLSAPAGSPAIAFYVQPFQGQGDLPVTPGESPAIPGCFVENRGQVQEGIAFYALGDPTFGFTPDGMMLLVRDETRAHAVDMGFQGANAVEPEGQGEVCYRSHFLRGPRSDWAQDVPAYPVLQYRNLYDGIDLTYRLDRGLKAEFHVRPGANPAAIDVRYEGATLDLDGDGNLQLRTPLRDLTDAAPFAYHGSPRDGDPIPARYLLAEGSVRFELGPYDAARPFVLDPLIFATLAGGFDPDRVEGIVVDVAGFAYVAGTTFSPDFPTTSGAFDRGHNAEEDVFVAKMNREGDGLVYATYLGGSSWEFGHGIALGGAGEVLVAGATASPDFPTTAGAFAPDRSGCCDAFVAKLNADGSDLVYATYLGGTGGDAVWSVVTDEEGTAYVVGDTASSDFPATNGSDDQTPNGSRDAFVARLSVDGSELVFATYLGGSGFELGYGIALDPGGGVYVTGLTTSFVFRGVTNDAYDVGFNGGDDAFLVRYDTRGLRLYGTYFGGADDDRGRDIAVDPRGFVYVTGGTSSPNLPTTPGAFDRTYNGGEGDVFVAKFYPGGRGLSYSTFLGGLNWDRGWGIEVDGAGNAYVTGRTHSANFPTTPDAIDTRFNGPDPDAFVSQLSPEGTTLLYSTFLGGRGWDQGWSVALDPLGAAYVAGETDSPDFPATVGAFDESANGLEDTFVAKLLIPPQSIVLDLVSPWNYGAIPPGEDVSLAVAGPGVTAVFYAMDEEPFQLLPPPYRIETASWSRGTHLLHAQVWTEDGNMVERSFVLFLDPTALWPPDTVSVDVVLIGFDLSPGFLDTQLRSTYTVTAPLRSGAATLDVFNLQFEFEVQAASAAYHEALLDHLQSSAIYRDSLQARLNITALVDQRDTDTARDIFDPLIGWEISTGTAETYLAQNPPVPLADRPGYTFYLLNLSGLDDPSAGVDHWFVEPTRDPDTQRVQDWFRLEWDNELNTPMGYALNAWGGPEHRVFVDPTAYQWYQDWAHVWWENRDTRAPYGLQFEEVPPTERTTYLAGLVNDLVEGLAAALPQGPPEESAVLIRNLVLSGSVNHTVDELGWVVSSEGGLEAYFEGFLPFKEWTVNTTVAPIEDFPALSSVVDANTEFVGNRGLIDAGAVFDYLFDNKGAFVADDPAVFEVLTVNFLYDNRSMFVAGREFTGLGGSGITAIFLKTDRLFDGDGAPQKGLTSIISHETGHNLGYGHQFGPHWRADFIEGNMGYFRRHLEYGTFWEDALHRVFVREKLQGVQEMLETREPLDLGPEFLPFYAHYQDLDFPAAYQDLAFLEAMLTDAEPPAAVLGPDMTVDEDESVVLDASNSTDNFRILTYGWVFGDGTEALETGPVVEKTWADPGIYTVTLTILDAAGNRDVTSLIATVRDTTRPLLSLTTPTSGAIIGTWNVQVVWSASDEGLGLDRFELVLDDASPIVLPDNARSHVLEGVPDGEHTLTLTAIDKADNRVTSMIAIRVETDFLSPTKPYGLLLLIAVGAGLTALATFLVYQNYRRRR